MDPSALRNYFLSNGVGDDSNIDIGSEQLASGNAGMMAQGLPDQKDQSNLFQEYLQQQQLQEYMQLQQQQQQLQRQQQQQHKQQQQQQQQQQDVSGLGSLHKSLSGGGGGNFAMNHPSFSSLDMGSANAATMGLCLSNSMDGLSGWLTGPPSVTGTQGSSSASDMSTSNRMLLAQRMQQQQQTKGGPNASFFGNSMNNNNHNSLDGGNQRSSSNGDLSSSNRFLLAKRMQQQAGGGGANANFLMNSLASTGDLSSSDRMQLLQKMQLQQQQQQQGGMNATFNNAMNNVTSSSGGDLSATDRMLLQRLQQQQQGGLNASSLIGSLSQEHLQLQQQQVQGHEQGQDPYANQGILGPWSERAAGLLGSMVCTNQSNESVKKGKKARRKQPKNKPKRPLSAYNIFFKEERERLMAKGEELKRTANGKIGFESLAKIIGGRWQGLQPPDVEYYKEKAGKDMNRYKQEMEAYKIKQQQGGDISKEGEGDAAAAEDAGEHESEGSAGADSAFEPPKAKRQKSDVEE